jgi:DNA-binding response OmpR family regulator
MMDLHAQGGNAGTQKRNALVLADSYVKGLVAEVLRDQGFSILRAPDAQTALAKLLVEKFELVVLDDQLPGGTDAGAFTLALRRHPTSASRRAWVLVIARTIGANEVRRMRNCGISSLLVGTLQLGKIEERIRVMANDRRNFIEAANYVGPDRRIVAEFFPSTLERRGNLAESTGKPEKSTKQPKKRKPAKQTGAPTDAVPA